MDAIYALVFAAGGLATMVDGDCPTGCLRRDDAAPALSFQLSEARFQGEPAGVEIMARRDLAVAFGPFQPMLAASTTEDGAAWVGAGLRWEARLGRLVTEASFAPGLYVAGDGPRIGTTLEFRSGLAAGWDFGPATVSVSLDHRSNGGLSDTNPGLETVGLRVTIPLD